MPVPRNQVSTIDQAYDYAMGSAAAAKGGVCPSQTAVYEQLASQVTAGAFGTITLDRQRFLNALAFADSQCKAAPDYKPTAPQVTINVPPDMIPTPPVLRAGFPWWIVLLLGGAGLAYYLYTKKDKKKPAAKEPKKRRKYGRIRRRVKGQRGRRMYTTRKNR